MFRRKIDGVIEAVKYNKDKSIDWVRFYERRGYAYSDRLLLGREQLINRLDAGELFYTGQRTQYQGNTFNTQKKVITEDRNGNRIVLTEGAENEHDHLEGVPVL